MILFLVSYLGGVLTILSPCILPVLPFVFARADRPFMTSGLPLLLGMAITFAAVATLAAVGGGWAVEANHYGRLVAIVLLALFGVTLLFPELADRMTARPSTKDYSALSVWIQSQSHPQFVRSLPPTVFWPRPRVTSAILQIDVDADLRSRIADPEYFHKVVDCQYACPAHTPVPEYIRLIAAGRQDDDPMFIR